MVIDCHYHADERILPVTMLLRQMDVCGVDRIVLMASLNEPIPEVTPMLARLLLVLLSHRTLRPIGRLLAAHFTPAGDIAILGKTYHIYPDPDNGAVFRTVEAYPDRFLGWVFVNPHGHNDPVAELERWEDHPACVGVKAHPFWHRYPPVDLVPVAERLAVLGKPLLIHAGFGEHGDFLPLVRKVPGLKLILAHAGFPAYAETWKAIRDTRICVDLSQTYYVNDMLTRAAVAALGPERCLFGTDGPYGFTDIQGIYDYGFIKRRLERLFPDRSVLAKILGANFGTLIGRTA